MSSYWQEHTVWPLIGSVNRGLPVSQHLPPGGPPPEVVGADATPCPGCDGLTEDVGLPGAGLTIPLVTAILVVCEPPKGCPLPLLDALPALALSIGCTAAGDGDDANDDPLTVTAGHWKHKFKYFFYTTIHIMWFKKKIYSSRYRAVSAALYTSIASYMHYI